jgi:hypothetical protein
MWGIGSFKASMLVILLGPERIGCLMSMVRASGIEFHFGKANETLKSTRKYKDL